MHEGTRVRPVRFFLYAVLFSIAFLAIDFAFNLLVVDEQKRILFSDVASPGVDALVFASLWIAARHSAGQSKKLGIAWGMIALSALAFALGDCAWAILELGLSEPPFPSVADLFYLLYFPFLLAGTLLLPEDPATRGERIKNVLDAGIVMVAAILAFWNFLMGPLVASNAEYPLLDQVILIAYPVGDLVLIWALLRIMYKRSDKRQENDVPAFLLAAGLIVTILADCIYTYQAFIDIYASGGILDVAWRGGMLMIGLAGIAQVDAVRSGKIRAKVPGRLEMFVGRLRALRAYFPYFWLIAAYIILMRSETYPMYMDFFSLSLTVGGIIGLVLLRQVVTLSENHQLNATLRGQTHRLELANQELQNEITERKAIEQQLSYDSLHDAMTGLPNRVLFLDRLGQAIKYCKRRTEYIFALLFVDIDQFKVINDSLGHLTGDQLLIAVGRRMKESLRSSDTVARLGGDEFAILLEITGDQNSVIRIAEKLQEQLMHPFSLDSHELYVTASIGVVPSLSGYVQPEEVLRDADIAMYYAKSSGKARFEIFDVKMRSHAFSRLQMEQEMRIALENGDFELYYQPIMSMQSDQLVRFEALVRWTHPTRGLLLPGEFLPIAEESGLIVPLERWILDESCRQLRSWHDRYPSLQNVSMNVNISNRLFSQPDFVARVLNSLQKHGLKPETLKLEITENVLISNYKAANEVFTKLRDQGVELEIDDFGSGYSALGYLQHFPISAIKIDKSFVDEIGKSRRGLELIRAILSMARELEIEAIAEGIETAEQLDQLKSLSCNLGQGFLLSRPLDKKAAEAILASHQEKM